MVEATSAKDGLRVSLGRSPIVVAIIAIACAGLVALGLLAAPKATAPNAAGAPSASRDAVLYESIIEEVRAGAPYYRAAVEAHRDGHYPLHPFITVRPPVLAVTLAALPNELARRGLLTGLVITVLAAWTWRLRALGATPLEVAAMLVALATGTTVAFFGPAYLFHEVWAGLLIALSLAVRRPDRWTASLLIGLLAALTRELASAYLLAMAALAWRDGCRREALAWLAALAAAGAALVLHAVQVEALRLPGDLSSQGWLRLGGWSFVLETLRWNLLFVAAPGWMVALAAPPALVGLAAWRQPLGERVALTVFGYAAAFVVVGRPENNYWGLLIAPLWPLGLALAVLCLMKVRRAGASSPGSQQIP